MYSSGLLQLISGAGRAGIFRGRPLHPGNSDTQNSIVTSESSLMKRSATYKTYQNPRGNSRWITTSFGFHVADKGSVSLQIFNHGCETNPAGRKISDRLDRSVYRPVSGSVSKGPSFVTRGRSRLFRFVLQVHHK